MPGRWAMRAFRLAGGGGLDQPHCAFIPHVEVLYPDYYDPQVKKIVPTGQKFVIANSAPVTHNVNWNPRNTVVNVGGNRLFAPQGRQEIALKSGSRPGQEDL